MSEQELAAIRERVAKATPGSWRVVRQDQHDPAATNTVAHIRGLVVEGPYSAIGCGDEADFIAHARADVPALLAEIDRLRAAHGAGAAQEGGATNAAE